MEGFLSFLAPIAMIATLVVLVIGVIVFLRGGNLNRQYGNKLMQMRVMLQAIAIGLILLVMWLAKGS